MKGWFVMPGIQEGERTLEEQSLGLKEIFPLAIGKSVLDLGCAEGLIALEFALIDASRVVGVDANEQFIETARKYCRHGRLRFELSDLREEVKRRTVARDFDIVLALGVIHKLADPAAGLRYAARRAKEIVVLRWGMGREAHICVGKHSGVRCDSLEVMESEGFEIVDVFAGPPERSEDVALFWKKEGD